MDPETLEMRRQARRLMLAVATDLDDARLQVLKDVGFAGDDALDQWYCIAVLLAQEVADLLAGEFIAAYLFCGKDLPPNPEACAREHAIHRIETMLAKALDSSA